MQPSICARCRKSFLFFFFFFFFLFSLSSEPVSCDIAVAVASTLPCPHTGDILSAPPQHHNYHTNPMATPTTAMSHVTLCRHANHLLHLPSHASWAHTSHPTAIALTVPSAPKKSSDKTFPLFSPFIFNSAGHLPSRACRLPLHRRHNHHHLNASMTGATSLTPLPYNWRLLTLPHRQGVQKVCWPPPFLQDPHLLTLPLCVGHSTCMAAPIAPSGLRACPVPPCPACCPPLHARGCRRDSVPLVPSAWAMPHARGRAMCKGKGHVQGEGEGLHARGGGGCVSEWGCARTEGGVHPFCTPCTQ